MHVGVGGSGRAELGLVEVGLEAGLEDVEGRGEGGGCHSAYSVQGEREYHGQLRSFALLFVLATTRWSSVGT